MPLPRVAPKLSTALCLRAGAFPALPRAQIDPPVATSSLSWTAQDRAWLPYISRASEPGGSPRPSLLTLVPIRQP